MHRVAVTGVGVISALGRTAAEFARSLREGRSGIGPIRSADVTSYDFRMARRSRVRSPPLFR